MIWPCPGSGKDDDDKSQQNSLSGGDNIPLSPTSSHGFRLLRTYTKMHDPASPFVHDSGKPMSAVYLGHRRASNCRLLRFHCPESGHLLLAFHTKQQAFNTTFFCIVCHSWAGLLCFTATFTVGSRKVGARIDRMFVKPSWVAHLESWEKTIPVLHARHRAGS